MQNVNQHEIVILFTIVPALLNLPTPDPAFRSMDMCVNRVGHQIISFEPQSDNLLRKRLTLK